MLLFFDVLVLRLVVCIKENIYYLVVNMIYFILYNIFKIWIKIIRKYLRLNKYIYKKKDDRDKKLSLFLVVLMY